jgi:hypothetical protein
MDSVGKGLFVRRDAFVFIGAFYNEAKCREGVGISCNSEERLADREP